MKQASQPLNVGRRISLIGYIPTQVEFLGNYCIFAVVQLRGTEFDRMER